jgi:predicted nucleotidyltransferase
VQASLSRFRAALDERFGARLREVVLFGSYARGEADEESDVDVLVVIDELTDDELFEVADLAHAADAADAQRWTGLSPFTCSTEHAQDMRSRERRVFRDIDGEGIRL